MNIIKLKEEMSNWTIEKLHRKADQAWEMAGLARQDGDKADEIRHTEEAVEISIEIGRRLQ